MRKTICDFCGKDIEAGIPTTGWFLLYDNRGSNPSTYKVTFSLECKNLEKKDVCEKCLTEGLRNSKFN